MNNKMNLKIIIKILIAIIIIILLLSIGNKVYMKMQGQSVYKITTEWGDKFVCRKEVYVEKYESFKQEYISYSIFDDHNNFIYESIHIEPISSSKFEPTEDMSLSERLTFESYWMRSLVNDSYVRSYIFNDDIIIYYDKTDRKYYTYEDDQNPKLKSTIEFIIENDYATTFMNDFFKEDLEKFD